MRLFIEHLILKAYLHQFLYRILFTNGDPEVPQAHSLTLPAYIAFAAVNDSFSFRRDRYSSLWTNGSTPAASGTLLSVDLQFRLKSLCLWIVAPATPEMAPLEKNSSAYPVTVMY